MISQKYLPKNILNSIIPISRFNQGEAGKIFEEVSAQGTKIVVKNNIPTCVLIEPAAYSEMMEALEDYALLCEAEDRLKTANPANELTHEQILEKYRIAQSDLEEIEVEIE